MIFNSGSPQRDGGPDLNGDSLFTDRPPFATDVTGPCQS
jgi:hypothetical protein